MAGRFLKTSRQHRQEIPANSPFKGFTRGIITRSIPHQIFCSGHCRRSFMQSDYKTGSF